MLLLASSVNTRKSVPLAVIHAHAIRWGILQIMSCSFPSYLLFFFPSICPHLSLECSRVVLLLNCFSCFCVLLMVYFFNPLVKPYLDFWLWPSCPQEGDSDLAKCWILFSSPGKHFCQSFTVVFHGLHITTNLLFCSHVQRDAGEYQVHI